MKKVFGLALMSIVNQERTSIGLAPVAYNFTLHNYLDNVITDNGSWFYESGPDYTSWVVEGQTRSCDLRGCFLKPLGHTYMFRDTYKDSVPKIFRYRIKQRNCDHTDFADGYPCSWYYAYYPTMMSNYTSFACKALNYQGRYVPIALINKQMKSFWCYFNGKLKYMA
jgi:hypothetical protein